VKAFKNLQLIAQAQKKYKQMDYDADGKNNYAKFFIHLWTAVNTDSEPTLIKLIPKKIAFAMGAASAIDGYYFRDLHSRELPEKNQTRKLDYEKEWAVTCAPAAYRKTGFLTFLADSSGDILAKKLRDIPSQCPYDPLSNGWTKVESMGQLKNFQKTVDYVKK